MSAESSKKAQKRKSMADATPSTSVRLAESSSSVGPVFVNFPSVRPNGNTPFTLYTRDPGSASDITKQHTILAGETDDVEFFSTNRDRQGGTEGADCQYLPAVYNPATGSLDIYPSTPLYLLGHRVKRLRNAGLTNPQARAADYKAKRNDLGEVFGTKKAKSQIRAEERNKVDIGAMQGLKGHLMEAIGEKEEESAIALPSELIPTPDLDTIEPSLVYPREALIPEGEWMAIDANALIKAKDDKERAGLLPYRRSRYAESKMRMAIGSGSSTSLKKSVVRMAYYLTALLGLYDMAPRVSKLSKTELAAKFPGIPPQLLTGLLDRFTEPTGKRYAVTEKTKTKLLAWICVVYLHLDDFSVELGKLSKDLNLPQTKVADMYKGLGCKVDIPAPAEREKLGISITEARANRRAVLKAPVVFPRAKTRAPSRR